MKFKLERPQAMILIAFICIVLLLITLFVIGLNLGWEQCTNVCNEQLKQCSKPFSQLFNVSWSG